MSKKSRHENISEGDTESDSNVRLVTSSFKKETNVGPSGDYEFSSNSAYSLRSVMKNNSSRNSSGNSLDDELYGINDDFMRKLNVVRKKLNLIEISDSDAETKVSRSQVTTRESEPKPNTEESQSSTVPSRKKARPVDFEVKNTESYYEISGTEIRKKGTTAWSVSLETSTELNTIYETSSMLERDPSMSAYLQITYDPPKKKICKRQRTPVLTSRSSTDYIDMPYGVRVGMDSKTLRKKRRQYLESKCTQYSTADVDTDDTQDYSLIDMDRAVGETQIAIEVDSSRSCSGKSSCRLLKNYSDSNYSEHNVSDDAASASSFRKTLDATNVANDGNTTETEPSSDSYRSRSCNSATRSNKLTSLRRIDIPQADRAFRLDLSKVSLNSSTGNSMSTSNRYSSNNTTRRGADNVTPSLNTPEIADSFAKPQCHVTVVDSEECDKSMSPRFTLSSLSLPMSLSIMPFLRDKRKVIKLQKAKSHSAPPHYKELDRGGAVVTKESSHHLAIREKPDLNLQHHSHSTDSNQFGTVQSTRPVQENEVAESCQHKNNVEDVVRAEFSHFAEQADQSVPSTSDNSSRKRRSFKLSQQSSKSSQTKTDMVNIVSSQQSSSVTESKSSLLKRISSRITNSGGSSVVAGHSVGGSTKTTSDVAEETDDNEEVDPFSVSGFDIPKIFSREYSFPAVSYLGSCLGTGKEKNKIRVSSSSYKGDFDSDDEWATESIAKSYSKGYESYKETARKLLESSKGGSQGDMLPKIKSNMSELSQHSGDNKLNLRRKQSVEMDYYSVSSESSLEGESESKKNLESVIEQDAEQGVKGLKVDTDQEVEVRQENDIEHFDDENVSDSDDNVCDNCFCFKSIFKTRETQFY